MNYLIIIDNGAGYCAALPQRFDTEADAIAYGENWLADFYIDNGIPASEREDCGAGFAVQEPESADSEAYQDDEMQLLNDAGLSRGQP